MDKIIIGILGSSALAILWIYVLHIHIRLRLKFKPFNCGFCLSFWFSFLFFNINFGVLTALYLSAITPFIYLFIEDLITSKWEL